MSAQQLDHPHSAHPISSEKSFCDPITPVLAVLRHYRALLAMGWSPDTAYPGFIDDASSWEPGDPRGQCGVSTVWLAEQLSTAYGLESEFCCGDLAFGDRRQHELTNHCWLELEDAHGDTLVLDLTADQADGFDRPFLLASKAKLADDHVWYLAHTRTPHSKLSENRAWTRYEMLVQTLEQVFSDADYRRSESVVSI